MKIFTAALLTESSDLTPIPTTEKGWEVTRTPVVNGVHSNVLSIWRHMAEDKGWEVSESICAVGITGGRVVRSVYEKLRAEILDDLKHAMPVDAVILNLHGAAMAYGYDDCEGDLLSCIREMVGSEITVGCELDPHCHISKKMMDHATILVLYKTMMHTDIEDRAIDLFYLVEDTLEKRITPVMALFDCRMMNCTGFDESKEPMKSCYDRICAVETLPDVLSISPVHGFPLADIPDMGSKMLVVTDNNLSLAAELAETLGHAFHTVGTQLLIEGIDSSLDKAQKRACEGEKAISLCEISDLVGCGFPTDCTEVIHAMIRRGMTNLAVGFIWDPLAVAICLDVGAGVQIKARFGGKASYRSGIPLDLKVIVDRVYKDISIKSWGGVTTCCDAAVVRHGQTILLLTSTRVVGDGYDSFRQLGVDPSDKEYLLFKFVGNLTAPMFIYGPNYNFKTWDFTKIKRPMWPWDTKPFDDNSIGQNVLGIH